MLRFDVLAVLNAVDDARASTSTRAIAAEAEAATGVDPEVRIGAGALELQWRAVPRSRVVGCARHAVALWKRYARA